MRTVVPLSMGKMKKMQLGGNASMQSLHAEKQKEQGYELLNLQESLRLTMIKELRFLG